MTATERLRALLDERGVEWIPYAAFSTLYTTPDGKPVRADGDFMKGRVELYVRNLTPEQAVEATLGRGECRMAHRVLDGDVDVWKCCECGMYCSVTQDAEGGQHAPRYCPNCGAKVVDA